MMVAFPLSQNAEYPSWVILRGGLHNPLQRLKSNTFYLHNSSDEIFEASRFSYVHTPSFYFFWLVSSSLGLLSSCFLSAMQLALTLLPLPPRPTGQHFALPEPHLLSAAGTHGRNSASSRPPPSPHLPQSPLAVQEMAKHFGGDTSDKEAVPANLRTGCST
jgi:hypothetical protein